MSIDAIGSDDIDTPYGYEVAHQVKWYDREVQKLDECDLLRHFTLSAYLKKFEPMMSGGNLSGGVSYTEKEGLKIEIKVEAELGSKNSKESNGSENNTDSTNTQSDPPDNRDRESGNN